MYFPLDSAGIMMFDLIALLDLCPLALPGYLFVLTTAAAGTVPSMGVADICAICATPSAAVTFTKNPVKHSVAI